MILLKEGDCVNSENNSFSQMQNDYLYGALLGDGCLSVHKRCINATFSYLSKSFQHVYFVSKPFLEYSNKGIVHRKVYDNRTNKIYETNVFRTRVNPLFTKEYNIWYQNGIKHIPYTLKLNPTICLIWYLGDGGLAKSSSGYSCYLKLSTHCFSKEEQEEILLPQLKDFSPRLYQAGVSKLGKKQYIVAIRRKNIADFLDYIGECPFDDYKYKWDNPIRKNFSIDESPEKIEEMINLFNQGCSSGTIAKQVGVDRSTVMKYLSLNGFNYRDNLFKKGIPHI